jgi:hypothetical protein
VRSTAHQGLSVTDPRMHASPVVSYVRFAELGRCIQLRRYEYISHQECAETSSPSTHHRPLINVNSHLHPKTHPSPPTSPYNNSSLALTLTLVPNTQSYPTHHRNANQRHPSHTSHNRHRAQSKGLNHTQPSTFLFFFAKSAPYLQCHHQKAVLTSLLFLQQDGQD